MYEKNQIENMIFRIFPTLFLLGFLELPKLPESLRIMG